MAERTPEPDQCEITHGFESSNGSAWRTVWTRAALVPENLVPDTGGGGEGEGGTRGSMHSVEVMDLRKSGAASVKIERPKGVAARIVRVKMHSAKDTEAAQQGRASVWRVAMLGSRVDPRARAPAAQESLTLFLVDTGGTPLGVGHARLSLQVVDPRPVCPFVYLLHSHTCDFDGTGALDAHAGACSVRGSFGRACSDPTVLSGHPASLTPRLALEATRRFNVRYLIIVHPAALLTLLQPTPSPLQPSAGDDSLSGAFRAFEAALLRWRPAVGVPRHADTKQASTDEASGEVEAVYAFWGSEKTLPR